MFADAHARLTRVRKAGDEESNRDELPRAAGWLKMRRAMSLGTFKEDTASEPVIHWFGCDG
jgi:hypothetical protein